MKLRLLILLIPVLFVFMGCPQEVSDDSDDKKSEKKVIVDPSPGEDEPKDDPAVEPSPGEDEPKDDPVVEPSPEEDEPKDDPAVEPSPGEDEPKDDPAVEPSPGEDEPKDDPVVEPSPEEDDPKDDPVVEPSSDNNIKSVVIDNCFIDKTDFDGQDGYTILFPEDATTLKIQIELSDEEATIEEVYGEATLESDGSFTTEIEFNLFDLEFKVTAENNEEKNYKLRFVNETIMQMQM